MLDNEPARLPVTIIILTLNEDQHLGECLDAARALTDRILVLDSGSTDHTRQIALDYGVQFKHREFDGYARQRNAALQMVDTEWVLFIDADEVMTPKLIQEIRLFLNNEDPTFVGAWLPRDNRIGNRSVTGGGWSPDYQLRLFRRERGRYDDDYQVHERLLLDGATHRFTARLIHSNFASLAEFNATQRRYLDLLVQQHCQLGDYGRRRTIIGRPLREFHRRYVSLNGYRDGLLGLYLALAMAWYEFRLWWSVRGMIDQDNGNEGVTITPTTTNHQLSDADGTTDISVIIVSYNTNDLLSKCLASIEAWFTATDTTGEVIVVDNASTDGTSDMVRRRFPGVQLIQNQHNHGFAAANNQGIRTARGRYIALLNPDTTIIGDAFGLLIDFLDQHPEVAIAGPRLVYPDGSTQPSRRRFPTRLTGFLESTIVQEWWGNNRVIRRYYMDDQPDTRSQDVDWLVGACLVARRSAIQEIGLLDERYFMYSEEIEWCHRMKQHGWRIVYHPIAQVTHHEGSSSMQNVPARQINFDSSKVLLYEQLHGKLAARSLHLFLLLTYLIRIVLESGKGIIGHKRPLRWQRVRMYCRVLAARVRGSGGRG